MKRTIFALLLTLILAATMAIPALAAKPKPTPTPIVVKQPKLLTAYALRRTECHAPLTGRVVYKARRVAIKVVGQTATGYYLTYDLLACPVSDFTKPR